MRDLSYSTLQIAVFVAMAVAFVLGVGTGLRVNHVEKPIAVQHGPMIDHHSD